MDVSLVEEFNNLVKQMSVHRLPRFKKVTNPRTNGSPQIVLAKFVMLVDWPKLHETRILPWPRGRSEDILGCLENQLETPVSGTSDTEIVMVGLKFGDIVGRELDGRNDGGGGVLLAETAVIGVVWIAVVRYVALANLPGTHGVLLVER